MPATDEMALYLAEYVANARQLRTEEFAAAYYELWLSAVGAAAWANAGFLPNEAAPWLVARVDLAVAWPAADQGLTPAQVCFDPPSRQVPDLHYRPGNAQPVWVSFRTARRPTTAHRVDAGVEVTVRWQGDAQRQWPLMRAYRTAPGGWYHVTAPLAAVRADPGPVPLVDAELAAWLDTASAPHHR